MTPAIVVALAVGAAAWLLVRHLLAPPTRARRDRTLPRVRLLVRRLLRGARADQLADHPDLRWVRDLGGPPAHGKPRRPSR